MAGAAGPNKGDLRAAAERLERGIERYGEGDLPGALAEFDKALELHPASARSRQYASWVRDLQSGKRRLDGGRGLDEDALRAVNEALEDTPIRRRPSSAETTQRGLQPPAGAPTNADDDDELTVANKPRDRIMTPAPPTEPPLEPTVRARPPTLDRARTPTPAPPPATVAPTVAQIPTPVITSAPPAATIQTIDEPRARSLTPAPTDQPRRGRLLTPTPPPPTQPSDEARLRQPTPAPPASQPSLSPPQQQMGTAPTVAAMPATPAVTPGSSERQRRMTPARGDEPESPWDPVPLTPRGSEVPPELRKPTAAAPAGAVPPPLADASSATIMGMPPLEQRTLTPTSRKRVKLTEEHLEPVTREFRSSTPTGPGLRPLDVPELTDEQIAGLLALDSPLLRESHTSPQIELDRIDYADDSVERRLVEMEADATPLPTPAPPEVFARRDDTNPMAVNSFAAAEFDPAQLTPTGIKPSALKPVRAPQPEDDPYADINLLPLEVPVDIGSLDEGEAEEGGTNPTNPFIRGQRLAEYTSFAHETKAEGDSKVDELPPLPTLPGARTPKSPLAGAEAALNAGNFAAAVDECERVLAATGGLQGRLAQLQLPLVEQIYGAMLEAPEKIPVHGEASADLDPRSAFLLSRIDGAMTVEDVLDVSGMPRLEALRGLALLVRRRAVLLK